MFLTISTPCTCLDFQTNLFFLRFTFQSFQEAKEESSSTDALSELQKLGANALAAAMGQSSTDGSKVKGTLSD